MSSLSLWGCRCVSLDTSSVTRSQRWSRTEANIDEKEFLEGQKNYKREPGNKLVVETDFKPEEPLIVLLNFK